jgi:hypothetical protein
MGARHWVRWLLAAAAFVLLAIPAAAQNSAAFERGYREGVQRGADDARRGRSFELERDDVYRSADRGYNNRYGDREWYRNDFRRGFSLGYRSGYSNIRGDGRQGRRDDRGVGRDRRGLQEPAFARGYSDGWEKGVEDRRDRDRFDPTRHGDYRDADDGYKGSYGSKDAYRNNYRSGFREGYEDGYRERNSRR